MVEDPTFAEGLRRFLLFLAGVSAVALVAAAVLAVLLWRRLKKLQVTPGAGFWQTLREVPFGLVVVLDLLDLALDVFATPVVWWLLGRLNLRALREVASVEALVPFTGPIPMMSACWLIARFGAPAGRPPGGGGGGGSADVLQGEKVGPGRWRVR